MWDFGFHVQLCTFCISDLAKKNKTNSTSERKQCGTLVFMPSMAHSTFLITRENQNKNRSWPQQLGPHEPVHSKPHVLRCQGSQIQEPESGVAYMGSWYVWRRVYFLGFYLVRRSWRGVCITSEGGLGTKSIKTNASAGTKTVKNGRNQSKTTGTNQN